VTAYGTPRGSAARFESEYASYRRQKRVYAALFGAAFVVCLVAAGVTAKFDVLTLIQGLPRTTEFLVKLIPPIGLATFAHDMGEWYWDINKWLGSLLNTLLMAYLATVLGTVLGGFLSFFAARNLARHYLTYWLTRRALEIARTVPDIVWALLFVIAFGIGPLAGILAITVHTIGAQGKLFAEVNENVSPLPIDGIRRHVVPGDPLRRPAAGDPELPVVHLLAPGAERAQRHDRRLRRRRRHRARPVHVHPAPLLLRRRGDPAHHRRDDHAHRHPEREVPAQRHRQGRLRTVMARA
jgi:hypothetical protein